MTHTTYLVLIEGRPWGTMLWRGYRLLLVRGDGSEHLFHRAVALRKAREAVARETGKPLNAVRTMKLAGAALGEGEVDDVTAAPANPLQA